MQATGVKRRRFVVEVSIDEAAIRYALIEMIKGIVVRRITS